MKDARHLIWIHLQNLRGDHVASEAQISQHSISLALHGVNFNRGAVRQCIHAADEKNVLKKVTEHLIDEMLKDGMTRYS